MEARTKVALIHLAAAIWGFALALSFAATLMAPAPPDQLPGRMSALGIHAATPYRITILAILLPLVLSALSGPIASRFANGRTWAAVSVLGAACLSMWAAFLHTSPGSILVSTALLVVTVFLVRHRPILTGTSDLLLVPASLSLFFALWEVAPDGSLVSLGLWSVTSVALLRILLALRAGGSAIPPGDRVALVPLGLLVQIRRLDWTTDHTSLVVVLLVTFLVPVLLSYVRKPSGYERIAPWVLRYAIFPIIIVTYVNVVHSYPGGKPVVDFFEDGHGLLPASEMMAGELPYRDITPGHGLLTDGLVDLASLEIRGETIGKALRTRHLIYSLNGVAIYALGFAATGSPVAGMVAFALSFSNLVGSPMWWRTIPAFFALAFAVSAIRLRSARRFRSSGFFLVLAGLTSLDFALYSSVTVLLAAFRFGSGAARWMPLRELIRGAAILFLPIGVVAVTLGIADDFFRVTFGELLGHSAAYTTGINTLPNRLRELATFPEILGKIFEPRNNAFVVWAVAVLIGGAGIGHHLIRARRRTDPLFLIAFWIGLAGISFAEREHFYVWFAYPAFVVTGLWILIRSRRGTYRAAAVALGGVLFVLNAPTSHVLIASENRRATQQVVVDMSTCRALPRAHDAWFRQSTARRLEIARRYASQLGPNDTYFDFSNTPLLYFLLDRRSPIRQVEVPQYESSELQQEVVSRLESDRSVRAVLIAFPHGDGAEVFDMDGVPNRQRAPLVWSWIQQHFRPDFAEDGVEFWRRID